MSNKGVVAIILIAIVVVGVFSAWKIAGLPYMVHGYDGPTATLGDIESDADRAGSNWLEENTGSSAAAYPPNPDFLDALVPCGTHITIQSAPVVAKTTIIDNISVAIVDEVAKTNKTKTWSVQEVEAHMGITVETYRGGILDTVDTTYWIQLAKNALSVFSNADESEAYIIQVFAYAVGEKTGSIEVTGEDQGYTFPLTSLESVTVPKWITDSGYTSNLQYFSKIKFPVDVLEAAPTTVGGALRAESKIDLHIAVMVLLFGVWERVVPYIDWEGADNPDPLKWLWDLLGAIGVFLWLIIAFALTIIIVVKVPDTRFKVAGLAIVWLIVAWQLGWLDMLWEGLG